MKRDANFIGGAWRSAENGQSCPVTNPATGAIIGRVPESGAADANAAVAAASEAFARFRETTAAERADMLIALHDAIRAHTEDLAAILTEEQGKPLREARAEIGMSAAYVRWFAEEARRVYGRVIPSPWKGRRLMSLRQPVGVVAAITPWNFPSSMLARKIAPALAAGCTVVAKPASQTPFSALAWGVLAERAGLPAGVLNIVTGPPREVGGAFLSHPAVRKITFTGSTPVGRILLQQAGESVKKVSMELGGNAPFIVFEDADLDAAVEGALAAKFRNSGQTCVCSNRIYVQEGIHDAFVARLAERIAELRVGEGTEDGVEQGPLIDEAALEKVAGMVADAKRRGGRVMIGGQRLDRPGHFFAPTLIEGATADMACARDEIFGPVAPVFRFATEAEAIAMANDTEYGLAAYFYTRDLARRFASPRRSNTASSV